MSDQRGLSDHPTDRLIRELIQAGRKPEQGEIDQVLARMANAPFDPAIVPVPRDEQGLSYGGRVVQRRDEALFVHLVRRVVRNRQWAIETTGEKFVDDVRRSVRWPGAKLALYQRRGGNMAASLAPTREAVPASRQGSLSLPWLLVVYSADRGIIVTGYQIASLDEVSIPEGTRWLPLRNNPI